MSAASLIPEPRSRDATVSTDEPRLRALEGREDDPAREAHAALEAALFEVKRVIVGQEGMLERLLVALLAGGHVLLEGVPGLAKTLTIKTVADVLGGSFKRLQFTPDLVPADLVGTRIYRPDTGSFDTELGPVFCNFLLADEINRAPAKVQSALLEVMQERQVTIGHDTHRVPVALPRPRHAEPDRVRGHLPAARGAGRPLHVQARGRLPGLARRGGGGGALPARAARRARGALHRGPRAPPARRPERLRRPARDGVRGRAHHGHARADGAQLGGVRRQPARLDQPRPRRPGARAAARPRLRARHGRARPGARRPAPPHRAHVRGAGCRASTRTASSTTSSRRCRCRGWSSPTRGPAPSR